MLGSHGVVPMDTVYEGENESEDNGCTKTLTTTRTFSWLGAIL